MCNNYAMFTTTEAMMRLRMEWERAMRNVPPLHVYPDYFAPIVRELDGRRIISLARWGLPSLKDPATEKPNEGTNIRHLGSTTEGLPRRATAWRGREAAHAGVGVHARVCRSHTAGQDPIAATARLNQTAGRTVGRKRTYVRRVGARVDAALPGGLVLRARPAVV
jgi:hypothetical protein